MYGKKKRKKKKVCGVLSSFKMQLIISKVDNVLQKRSSLPNLEERKRPEGHQKLQEKSATLEKLHNQKNKNNKKETERLGFEEEKEELLMGIFVI